MSHHLSLRDWFQHSLLVPLKKFGGIINIMNIKTIVDKIVKEGDINPNEYTVADRVEDVNTKYLQLIEWAMQIGSTETIANKETKVESFTLVDGLNTLVRTIPDNPFYAIEYTRDTVVTINSLWEPLTQETFYTWCGDDFNVSFDEKRIIIEKAKVGTLKVTYARGIVVPFTAADYSNLTPPSPTWLPETFHPLLWLEPTTIQAEYYKKDRAQSLRDQLTKLEQLFYNHYNRNATQTSEVKTHRGNNR